MSLVLMTMKKAAWKKNANAKLEMKVLEIK